MRWVLWGECVCGVRGRRASRARDAVFGDVRVVLYARVCGLWIIRVGI